MIEIQDKHKCVGCRACEQICPKNCIRMKPDDEGFIYPYVDLNLCIDCHACEKVCPVINKGDASIPLEAYGCKNHDKNIQLSSSSGGVFTAIVSRVLQDGGIVCGAIYDDNLVVIHSSTESLDDLDNFRRSKYVQSDTRDTYSTIKKLLNENRRVLFCGTPCQVRGLLLFLRKKYENLTTLDFVCHGVPSPKVWTDYLSGLTEAIAAVKILNVNFRSKAAGGWHKYTIETEYLREDGKRKILRQKPGDNIYYQLFIQNISLRPSCYKCPAKGFSSGSDLTMSDFWGVERMCPEQDDNNGVSLLTVNTENGRRIVRDLEIEKFEVVATDAFRSNHSVYQSVEEPRRRMNFFDGSNTFSLRHMRNMSGMDLYGRIRRRLIEIILTITNR